MDKDKILPWLFVTLQLGSLFYIAVTGPLIASAWTGLLLESAGIALAVVAIYVAGIHNVNIRPVPKEGGRLITSGPYALIRHPMYLAQVVAVIPLVFDKPSIDRITVLVLLTVTLVFKMFYEEKGLVRQFGDAYVEYQKKSYRVLPLIF